MVWPIFLTYTASHSKNMRAAPDEVLKVLHDPEVLFRLNPLVVSVVADPRNPSSLYTVKDRLNILGFETYTTYKVAFTALEDGITNEVVAGAGTVSMNEYKVEINTKDPLMTTIVEKSTIKALFFLMPFITSTMRKAHVSFLDNIATQVERPQTTSCQPTVTASLNSASGTKLPAMFTFSLAALTISVSCFGLEPRVIGIVLCGVLLVALVRIRSSDPYGLFHLSLNRLPHEDLNTQPRTEWLNMGYWKNTDAFPDACKALALKMLEAVPLTIGQYVGHGTGESIILLLSEPSIPRPSSLTGITSLLSHQQRSQARVSQLKSTRPEIKDIPVHLYAGDAVYTKAAVEHPLAPSSSNQFDVILALDCAYHFDTRHAFLLQAFQKLSPSGGIALADICFAPDSLQNGRFSIIRSLLRVMPKQNMITAKEYLRDMVEIGYTDVSLEDITEEVFPGFIRFLRSRGWGWWLFAAVLGSFRNTGARFVIVSGRKARPA
ncbi:hypothetical protein BDQ12DRAFT_424626 [Crucibulum laeve]|uniref:DUF7053 domain-containing protein n=1 Tax=Crucibulum laeve TaxID=68775 RepID=A0A5C3MIS4_9AGAR|nr:hypothetical protein BDQ12DRAFT_424626 [Crucibulum laeve]